MALVAGTTAAQTTPTRVLFIGNSFTFVNDLPHQLANIANALGDPIVVANSTIGGCTIYHQTGEHDQRTRDLLQQDWDFIVLQDYSSLPTVQAARAAYLHPAVKSFAAVKKSAKIVMYMTWGYHDGGGACPTGSGDCFPLGSLASLTKPACATDPHYGDLAGSFICMGYAVSRGYASALAQDGADMMAPCGLAWQVVRGQTTPPSACRALTDAQYSQPSSLPRPFVNNGTRLDITLYRKLAGGGWDKHPNVAGQYLNALVFYATLFGKSPVGAPMPLNTGSPAAGDKPLSKEQIFSLQSTASAVVKQCGKACGL